MTQYKIKRTGEITDALGVRDLRSNEYTEITTTNMQKQTPQTKEEARQYAIDWQSWTSESNHSLSYGELADWSDEFTRIAEQFDLTEEFKENGII